jgi:tryptophan synthase alpha chain
VKLPIGVGFGIRDAATAKAVAEVADAVVIGSRIIQEIENAGAQAAVSAVQAFVGGIRTALDSK